MSFHNYMLNKSVGAPNPHLETPDLTPKEDEAINISFTGDSFTWAAKAAEQYGFPNVAELVNASLQIAMPVLEATKRGFTRMLLVNDATEDVMTIPLENDPEPDESTD